MASQIHFLVETRKRIWDAYEEVTKQLMGTAENELKASPSTKLTIREFRHLCSVFVY
jgi:hypothetical protein